MFIAFRAKNRAAETACCMYCHKQRVQVLSVSLEYSVVSFVCRPSTMLCNTHLKQYLYARHYSPLSRHNTCVRDPCTFRHLAHGHRVLRGGDLVDSLFSLFVSLFFMSMHMDLYTFCTQAKPPLGDLRWEPPQPAEPWTGVRNATAYSKACMQSDNVYDKIAGGVSEDCLCVTVTVHNLWAPHANLGGNDARYQSCCLDELAEWAEQSQLFEDFCAIYTCLVSLFTFTHDGPF